MSQKRKCVKQLMQVHQSRLPRYDRVVSSALTSTASGGSLAMFETLSSPEEVPCCGSNRNGHITSSDSISNSNKESIVCNNAVIFFRHTWLMWCHSLAFIMWKQNGSQQKQNGSFVVLIICYKVDDRLNHCYFQIFHGMNFHVRKNLLDLSFPLSWPRL